MKNVSRIAITVSIAGAVLILSTPLAMARDQANVSWSVSVGTPYPAPVYDPPPVVYVQPQPVYVQPQRRLCNTAVTTRNRTMLKKYVTKNTILGGTTGTTAITMTIDRFIHALGGMIGLLDS